jgi:hypothetical protein
MRANQAAIQRRVNTPRVQTQQPPSYGNNSNVQQSPQTVSNGYAPYPQPSSNNMPPPNVNYGQIQQNSQQPIAQPPTSGKMPQGLNPQQQLQFILNVLGERIAKLELNVATLSNSTSDGSAAVSNTITNPAFLLNAIANHPEIKTLKDSITRLQSTPPPPTIPQTSNVTFGPNVITEIQTDINTLFEQFEQFEQVENNDSFVKIKEELQTRTELLATEINQVKDMVLQLQSTVINTLLPAIVNPSIPPAPVSTLETFTEAPLNIIPQDPSITTTIMEENLENAVLPTITEPLTYQELEL